MQRQHDKCSECGTTIGPWGCCTEIRKLRRQIKFAADIAKQCMSGLTRSPIDLEKIIHELQKIT